MSTTKKNYVTINGANVHPWALTDINRIEMRVRELEEATKTYADKLKAWNKENPYRGDEDDEEAVKNHREARRLAMKVYADAKKKADTILINSVNNFYVRYTDCDISNVDINVEEVLRGTGIMTGEVIDNKAKKRIETYMDNVRQFNEARNNKGLISESKTTTYKLYLTRQKINSRMEALILFSFFFACGIAYNEEERFHIPTAWKGGIVATADGLPEEEATAPTKPEEATATA